MVNFIIGFVVGYFFKKVFCFIRYKIYIIRRKAKNKSELEDEA